MMSLLLLIAILGHSFDVAPEVCTEVQTLESKMFYIKDAAAEIAEDAMWLEPVHDSTTWLSLECAQVERTAWNGSTQGDTYFK